MAHNLSCYFYISFMHVFLIYNTYICALITLSHSSISCLYVPLISFLMVYSLPYLGIVVYFTLLWQVIITLVRKEQDAQKKKKKQQIISKVSLIKNNSKYILMQCIIIFIVTSLVRLVVGVPSVLQTETITQYDVLEFKFLYLRLVCTKGY